MADLISRQTAIDAFMTATADGDKVEWCEWVLKQVPSAQQWIPCSERLPEPGTYLVTYNLLNGMPYVGIYEYGVPMFSENGETVFYRANDDGIDCEREDVLAWMPLPEPWRGEEHETD